MKSMSIRKKLKHIFISLVFLALAGGSPAFGVTLNHSVDLNGDMYYNLAMSAGGTVYVQVKSSVSYPDADDRHRLYAINPDGTQRWVTAQDGHVVGDPVVGPDGTIYMSSRDNELVAIDSFGNIDWKLTIEGTIRAQKHSPVVGSDGTIYFGTIDPDPTGTNDGNGYLYAVNPDQTDPTFKWTHQFDTGTGAECTPVIATDGTIYVMANDLYAFWPDGTVKWRNSAANVSEIVQGMAIGADGTIYVLDGLVRAYNPADGSLKWTSTVSSAASEPTGKMAIGNDGTIYLGSDDHNLYSIDPDDGSLDDTYTTGGEVYSGPVVTDDGDVIFGSTDGKLYCLSPSLNIVRWTYDTGGDSFWAPSPVITDSGTIYAVTWNDVLILDGSMHNEAPSSISAWPRFRGNNRNNANSMGFSPTLVSPINNAMVPVVTDGVVNFDWDKISYAPGYQFQLSPDPAFSQVASGNTTDTDFDVASSTFASGYQYFWRVTSTDASSNGGSAPVMSEPQSFIYGTTLNQTVIMAPKYGYTVPNPVQMAWFMENAVEYYLQISTDQTFGMVNFGSFISVTSGTLGLSADTTYYMRVVGVDSNRQPLSNWSHVYTFTTKP